MPSKPKPTPDAYWFLATSPNGATAAIDDPSSFDEWSQQHSEWTAHLMAGEINLGLIEDASKVSDTGELIEIMIALPNPDCRFGSTFREFYTQGECHVFAMALAPMIDATIYAITDPYDDKGRKQRLHSLVHAGAYDGDDVIDIDGRNDHDFWTSEWCMNAGVYEPSTGPITAKRCQRLQMALVTPEEVANAAKMAWLIAGLTDALSGEQLRQLRAVRPFTARQAYAMAA